ncbi:MAG: HEPN domain-containing protein [Nanoarchaeota archaeon]|nr:HEPN domain-containing protein [Nanoarchaeota archaeon]
MNCLRAKNLLEDIENTIEDIKKFDYASDLEKSYLAKFLVVFISGMYEEIIETIISEKVEQLRSPQVSSFINKYLEDYFRNPKFEKILDLLKKFDENWAEELNKTEKILKIALDNIVINKNAIAHGNLCEITLPRVNEDYKNSKKVIEKIDQIILST